MKSWQIMILTAILPLSAGISTGVLMERSGVFSEKSLENTEISLEKIEQVKTLLENNFVEPEKITPEKLEEWLIRGVLYSVEDPYTEYFNEKQSEDFAKNMQGDFEGVGAALEKQKGQVIITEVMKNRPAANAGLLPGDIIVSIDEKTTEKETIFETVKRIRGAKGTVVHLEIYRNGEVKKFDVMRENIHVENVTFEMKGNIAVLEVNQFGEPLEQEFKEAFRAMQSQNPKGIIVDMRYNGGGYMDGAVALASYFLPEKTKVLGMKEHNTPEEEYFTKKQDVQDFKTPVVVLVNGGTASAAEIFAASLQEHKRATIIGEKTFGKGVVQKMFPLSKGSDEMVKITIAKWLTPNGKNITHENPLEPDKIVEWDRTLDTDEQKKQKFDPQMEKAIAILSK